MNIDQLKIILIFALFIVTLIFVLLPYKFLSFAQSYQNNVQRKLYENIFSFLNCFAAGVFLATCFLDLLPDVRLEMKKAFDLYEINMGRRDGDSEGFPITEFVVIFGLFIILTIEQIALSLKEKWFRDSKLQSLQSQYKHNLTQCLECPNSSPNKPIQDDQINERTNLLSDTVDKNNARLINGNVTLPQITATNYGSTNAVNESPVSLSSSINFDESNTSLLHRICDAPDYQTPSSFYERLDQIAEEIENQEQSPQDFTKDSPENSKNHHQPLLIEYDEFPNNNDLRNVSPPNFSESSGVQKNCSLKNGPSSRVSFAPQSHDPEKSGIPILNNQNLDPKNDAKISLNAKTHSHHHSHHDPVRHLENNEESGHPSFRLYMLVLSLAIHSLFEGMAIALQPTAKAILALFGALSFHKVTVAFSLGLNLIQCRPHMHFWPHILSCALIFSAMSPLGISLTFLLDKFGQRNDGDLHLFDVSQSQKLFNKTQMPINYLTLLHATISNTHPNTNKTTTVGLPFIIGDNQKRVAAFQTTPNSKILHVNNYSTSNSNPKKSWIVLFSALLQAIACGTFIYITFFELLPHEMNNARNRMLKVVFLIIGFAFVTAFIIYSSYYSTS